jgi:hypothetical protein
VRRGLWLACVAWCACVASESGNPAQRCEQTSDCGPDLVCYRSFCVEDESEVVETSDAGPTFVERDAAAQVSFGEQRPFEPGVGVVVDASASGPDRSDAGSSDAGSGDPGAAPDAGASEPHDAGSGKAVEPPAAGKLPCLTECASAPSSGECKRCVKTAFGAEPEKLCGKPDEDDEDDEDDDDDKKDKTLAGFNPICLALCLGAASQDSSCGPVLLCHGSKCGGSK